MNNYDYFKDLSDQIRSEIREFYELNAAFVLANSFLAILVGRLKELNASCWTLIIFVSINVIWFYLILLANKWADHWINKAQKEAKRHNKQTIWSERCGINLSGVSARKFFYCLPFLFSVLSIIIGCSQFDRGASIGLILFVGMVFVAWMGLISICKT